MKKPEEIKTGLECCIKGDCGECPYYKRMIDCGDVMKEDAVALIEQLEAREWELFNLLSSAFYGKQCYFKQDDGTVYSRATCEYLSFDQAIDEFAEMLTGEDETQSGKDMNVPRWISVEEELPGDGVDVIVYTDRCGGCVEYAYYRYGRYAWFKNCILLRYNVTHWIPMPKPPKEV